MSANGWRWQTPDPLIGLLAGARRLRRCLLAPPGTDIEKLRRRVYEEAFGEVPVGKTVKAGRCVRGRCVNPHHLRLGRARGGDGRVLFCRRGHPLFDANGYRPRPGARRVCRRCARDAQRRRAGRLHLLA